MSNLSRDLVKYPDQFIARLKEFERNATLLKKELAQVRTLTATSPKDHVLLNNTIGDVNGKLTAINTSINQLWAAINDATTDIGALGTALNALEVSLNALTAKAVVSNDTTKYEISTATTQPSPVAGKTIIWFRTI